MIAATPMKTKANETIGVIVSGWKMDTTNRIINEIRLGKTGYAFLIDKDGTFIAHPDKNMILNANIKNVKGLDRLAKRMVALEEGMEECVHQGRNNVVAFTPVKLTGWSLGLMIPKSEYMTPITKMRNIILIVSIVLLDMGHPANDHQADRAYHGKPCSRRRPGRVRVVSGGNLEPIPGGRRIKRGGVPRRDIIFPRGDVIDDQTDCR